MTLLVGFAVLAGALAQSVSGIGFGLVSGPFLVAALGGHEGVRFGVALSLLVNVVLLARFRRDVDRRGLLLLLVPAAVVTVPAAQLARQLPDRPAQAVAGVVVVLGAGLLALGVRSRAARGPAGAVVVGSISAVANVVAGVGGPPVALWADNADWSAARTRATLQAYFLGLNAVALASLGTPHGGGPLLISVVGLGAGLLVGVPLAHRVPEAGARRATLGLALTGGLVVLARALS